MRVLSVVGARPNFMKLAPVDRELVRRGDIEHVIVHTGQHYDPEMSDAFFEELWLPAPDYHLGVGSASHAAQTAAVMLRLEPILNHLRPNLVLVYGDVNSTLAAALVAGKLGLRIAHVEAGLRSGDWTMPEEVNRVLTDRLSDVLLTPSRDAVDNLLREGVPAERIHFVGNVMIDSLVAMLPAARALDAPASHSVPPGGYIVTTLHRPSNVDDAATLRDLLEALDALGANAPVMFPVHPRTRERIRSIGFVPSEKGGMRFLDPVGYLEMLSLVASAALVITDSGGLQEETTYLGIPCLTVRPSTERPITCSLGTNRLVAARREAILSAALDGAEIRARPRTPIERWDGLTAERIVQVICEDRSEPKSM
jgi:UDP-N-acetylglucosamine 2-epimerase (non-hydrolysing)